MLQVKGERSFRELMEKAAGLGHASKLSTWQQWGDPKFQRKLLPDPETIRAFSRGLGVTETEVLMAAARQVGLDVGVDRVVEGFDVRHGHHSTGCLFRNACSLVPMAAKTSAARVISSRVPVSWRRSPSVTMSRPRRSNSSREIWS